MTERKKFYKAKLLKKIHMQLMIIYFPRIIGYHSINNKPFNQQLIKGKRDNQGWIGIPIL